MNFVCMKRASTSALLLFAAVLPSVVTLAPAARASAEFDYNTNQQGAGNTHVHYCDTFECELFNQSWTDRDLWYVVNEPSPGFDPLHHAASGSAGQNLIPGIDLLELTAFGDAHAFAQPGQDRGEDVLAQVDQRVGFQVSVDTPFSLSGVVEMVFNADLSIRILEDGAELFSGAWNDSGVVPIDLSGVFLAGVQYRFEGLIDTGWASACGVCEITKDRRAGSYSLALSLPEPRTHILLAFSGVATVVGCRARLRGRSPAAGRPAR